MPVAVKTLRQFVVFDALTDEELVEVAKLCQEEVHQHGDKLFDEDEPAEKVYLILEGKISLDKKVQLGRSGSSRQATVTIRGPGRVTGWSSIVAPHIYTLSGICLEPSKLLVINGREMRDFINQNPETGLKLMTAIATIVSGRVQATTGTLTYFLSIISHELKSPLAAIENYLQIILGGFAGEITSKQEKMLQRSALRVKDLRSLINDILDLARMQPEHIQADFEWFDPVEVGAEAIENVQLAAKEKGIAVKVNARLDFHEMVGARRRLCQVFSNLLSNAIKFSPEGSVVMLHVRDKPDRLIFEIYDQGIGISADEQEHVFEDFFRGQNVGEAGGAGLGLAIVKKIVNAHNGEIWLESPYEPGKPGTKFTVVIPRNLATPEMKQQKWKSTQERREQDAN
jgi:signal transduction histidine kinase